MTEAMCLDDQSFVSLSEELSPYHAGVPTSEFDQCDVICLDDVNIMSKHVNTRTLRETIQTTVSRTKVSRSEDEADVLGVQAEFAEAECAVKILIASQVLEGKTKSLIPTIVEEIDMSTSVSSGKSSSKVQQFVDDTLIKMDHPFDVPSSIIINPGIVSLVDYLKEDPSKHSSDITEMLYPPRHRRKSHILAEQKRRKKIDDNLRTLTIIVPTLLPQRKTLCELNILQQTIKNVQSLKANDKRLTKDLMIVLRETSEARIVYSTFCESLPASGIMHIDSVSLEDKFKEYCNRNLKENWKFWIFLSFCKAAFVDYTEKIQQKTADTFISTLFEWVDNYLALPNLRTVVSDMMQELATGTSILSHPQNFRDDVTRHLTKSLENNE